MTGALELLASSARRAPDSPAVGTSDGSVGLSFGELDAHVEALADRLRQHGVGDGDTIAIVSDNRVEFAVALLAVVSTGARAAPVSPSLTVPEIGSALAAVNARATIVPDQSLGDLLAMLPDVVPGPVWKLTLDPGAETAGPPERNR